MSSKPNEDRWGIIRDSIIAVLASLLIVLFAAVLLSTGTIAIPPQSTNRPLANYYLRTVFNHDLQWLWSSSPETVSAILLDHRGIDTVYGVGIFFITIMATLMLTSKLENSSRVKDMGMDIITRSVSKIILLTLPVIAVSIALHGHLAPGGGFQGGTVFALAVSTAFIALGQGFLWSRGWSRHRLLGLGVLGLVIIFSIALAIPVAGLFRGLKTYIMQNQWKPWSPIGFGYAYNLYGLEILYSGSLLFLNIALFIAMSSGLTLVFTLLMLREEHGKGGHG